jgi:hypothetical protein
MENLRCPKLDIPVLFSNSHMGEGEKEVVTSTSAESKKGSARAKRRESCWISGLDPRSKKKLLKCEGVGKDDQEKCDEKAKDEEMEVEKHPVEEPSPGHSCIPDMTFCSNRPTRESTLPMSSNCSQD